MLSSTTIQNPTFVADLPGNYVAQLIVNDGVQSSLPSMVTITTTNSAPVANPGLNQFVPAPPNVALDGSGSTDADNDSLTYTWSFSSRPPGSNATLSSSTAVAPTFFADVTGTYVVQLIVNDGFADSIPGHGDRHGRSQGDYAFTEPAQPEHEHARDTHVVVGKRGRCREARSSSWIAAMERLPRFRRTHGSGRSVGSQHHDPAWKRGRKLHDYGDRERVQSWICHRQRDVADGWPGVVRGNDRADAYRRRDDYSQQSGTARGRLGNAFGSFWLW